MNFINRIVEASFVVQLVLLILVFFSVYSWAVIFFKRKTMKTASFQSQKFLKVFRRSSDLSEVNRASNQEISKLESMMNFLATTGSVTPFIGLFGTVWGIMDAFLNIEAQRSASLVTVAPGIAEALIATALGLFAAIPAVIAYNYYLHRIKNTVTEIEDFSLEFLSIAEKLYGS